MSIYGINFGQPDIPEDVRKKLPKRRPSHRQYGGHLRLQGACNYTAERDRMFIIADNGHREVVSHGPVRVEGVEWFGIYCS